MTDDSRPLEQRLRNWRQTLDTRLPGPEQAPDFIERLGLATLFPASPEIPNLYHAHMGDPEAATDSSHSSPSGDVYGWRWTLGRAEAAFYGAIVRNRPTWVSWSLLPAILRLRGESREPQALYETGELSADALRIADALSNAYGVLSTGDLREAAGFPTGKAQRTAYLKAVDELDTRLLLAKVFSPDDLEMRHALVRFRYPEHVRRAAGMSRAAALEAFLGVYLPAAVFAAPAVLARHLRLPASELREGLERLARAGAVERAAVPGYKDACFVWRGDADPD